MADQPPPSTGQPQQPQPGAPGGATAPYPTPSGPSGPRASFGQRFVAWLVDVIILGIVELIFISILNRNVASLLNLVLGLAYYTYLEGSPSGQTVGKKVLNIRVIDFNTGSPIDYGRAAIRYICRILSGLACLLGYFWMLWDREKQTWHDKLSTTVVVPTSAYPVAKWPG